MTITQPRRRWLAIPVAIVAMSIAIAGCGSSGGTSAGATSAGLDATAESTSNAGASPAAAQGGSLLPAAEGTTTYPLTLKSPWGETVLKQRPERIAVVTGANDLDNTLALGVTPVWADDWQASYEWTTGAGSAKIATRGEVTDTIPAEDVAASDPDLIIAIQTDADILGSAYDKLAATAPVLTVDAPSWDVTWQDSVRLIGSTLDLSRRAETVISDVDATIAAAANPAFQGKSLSFVLWLQGNETLTYRSFAGSSTEEFFAQLGFTAPATAAQFSRDNLLLSPENYGLIDADVVLVASPKEQFDKLLATPTFTAVPAIAQQRYALIDLSTEKELGWAVAWPSALSLPWLVGKVVPPLTETVG